MYIPTHFGLKELVYPEIYLELHDKDMLWVLWRKFDDRFLITIDQLRKEFGVLIINNWSLGKISWLGDQIFKYAGSRPQIIPIGEKWGEYTTHVDWNTGDIKVEKFGVYSRGEKIEAYNNMREFIIANPKKFPYITALESGDFAPTWLHATTANFYHHDKTIRIIKPR